MISLLCFNIQKTAGALGFFQPDRNYHNVNHICVRYMYRHVRDVDSVARIAMLLVARKRGPLLQAPTKTHTRYTICIDIESDSHRNLGIVYSRLRGTNILSSKKNALHPCDKVILESY